MVDEIRSQRDITNHNISTITLTKAQKRWRLIHFSIKFINTMLYVSKFSGKIVRYPISKILVTPSHTALRINANDDDNDTEGFRSVGRDILNDLMKNKDMEMLISKFNGVEGLAKSLKTTLEHGINSPDIERRKTKFGSNTCKKPSNKGFLRILLESFNNTTIVILILCAALSIEENGAKKGWDEGYKIFASLILVLVVYTITNFCQERQFHRLSKASNDMKIDVIRRGRRQKVSISNVVVGDVVVINAGDQIPAYGLLINGHSLLVDESSLTGDTDPIEVDANRNPFLFSGSKVANGFGRMLVISVTLGKMTSSSTSNTDEQTSLQYSINKLTSYITKIGIAVATLVPVIMLIRHFTGYTKYKNAKWDYQGQVTDTMDKLNSFTRTLMASAEDIPIAVTAALAYCRKKMIHDMVMVKKLFSSETMGSVTVICTNKTGTLTTNEMKITNFWFGLDPIKLYSSLDEKVLQLYHQGVGLNTTGSVYNSRPGMRPEYSGSPTEKALLSWAIMDLGMDMEKLKKDFTILHIETFNSKKKRSGVSVKKKEDDTIHVHWKGAAEMILAMCSYYYQKDGVTKSITPEEKKQFEKIIQRMGANGLRCIAFAHKEKPNESNTNYKNLDEEGLTLLGIVGIKDPCRPGAKEAINTCRSAQVNIKLITGDNIFTAKAVARECGILKAGQQVNKGDVITGEEFRNYTNAERMKKIDSILVIARSSPSDKLLMVQCLRKKGHMVAVIGHDTNDVAALKEADIGLSMGIHGTEVIKEISDIVILDDDISSVAKALKWGRCARNNIQSFVQFQLTVNIAALVINFVASAFATDAPLTVVQLLWVNIVMNTLGALALATEKNAIEFMNKQPVGKSFLNVDGGVKNTIIFNTFVLCQVFNEFNSRKLEKKNIFEGLYKNKLFLGIIMATLIIQVVMVEYLHHFADTKKLNRKQWGICMGVGIVSWLVGWFVKFIPVPRTPFYAIYKR